MISTQSRPRRKEGVLRQRASGTVLLLDLREGSYYALDEVGGRIWELCDGSRRVSEIVALLGQEYDAPAERIEADLLELLEELADAKLVVEGSEVGEGDPPAP